MIPTCWLLGGFITPELFGDSVVWEVKVCVALLDQMIIRGNPSFSLFFLLALLRRSEREITAGKTSGEVSEVLEGMAWSCDIPAVVSEAMEMMRVTPVSAQVALRSVFAQCASEWVGESVGDVGEVVNGSVSDSVNGSVNGSMEGVKEALIDPSIGGIKNTSIDGVKDTSINSIKNPSINTPINTPINSPSQRLHRLLRLFRLPADHPLRDAAGIALSTASLELTALRTLAIPHALSRDIPFPPFPSFATLPDIPATPAISLQPHEALAALLHDSRGTFFLDLRDEPEKEGILATGVMAQGRLWATPLLVEGVSRCLLQLRGNVPLPRE